MSLKYVDEGHYKNETTGDEYMSIWTYKRKNGMGNSSNEINFEDAKKITCIDKHWMPFNKSENFKSGYIYNINDLKEYYNRH